MKNEIHPQWYPTANVICQCGNTWQTGATIPEIRTEICSACHPFYTGEQRIVDTEGRVDRFMERMTRRSQIQEAAQTRKVTIAQPSLTMADLGVERRYVNVLNENGVITVQDFLTKLIEGGDDSILGFSGIGRQALSDMKKRLRARGYSIPASKVIIVDTTAPAPAAVDED